MTKRSFQNKIHKYIPKLKSLEASFGRKHTDIMHLEIINPWFEDYLNILTSASLFRLNGKMQVHPLNNGFDGSSITSPHISTRRMHTDLVIKIAAELALKLGLNIALCMAIATGHDVGHPPFGHNGERVLGVKHPLISAFMLQMIEKNGKGLNLTWEVVCGIINHSRNNEE